MPEPAGFASWRSYWDFSREVARRRRFFLSEESKAFLAELARTSRSRLGKIDAGKLFCRAQIAHRETDDPDLDPGPLPALPKRMIPRPDAAYEGRANAKGIPRLYMADERDTAIAEVRPWIGSLVSVAYLKTTRNLAIVDCRADDGRIHVYFEGEPSIEKREAAVWAYVARAFREPVLRDDDRADYAPTQMIVELFQEQGYDGVIYPSAFGSSSSNLVLFDITAAEVVSCELHEVSGVTLHTKEAANPDFVRKNKDGSVDIVRNVITAIGPIGGPMIDLRTGEEASAD